MKKYIYMIAIVILLLDQMAKQVIVSQVMLYSSIPVIPHFFQITYIQNLGGAWGILDHYTWVLILFSIGIFLFFHFYLAKQKQFSALSTISYGFFLGGLLGNLFDRVLRGYVVDYLDFYLFGYDFPVFNFADVMIVVAVFLFILEIGRDEVYEVRNRKAGKN